MLVSIIRQQGRRSVLADSTYGHGCAERSTGACENIGAPEDVWADDRRASSAPAPLRDLLPADIPARYTSELGDQSALPCRERSAILALSRVGISEDGRLAVVMYTHWFPMNHLGCGAMTGRTSLMERQPDGTWKEIRPLGMVIS